MEQDKIGKIIKDIRTRHKLSQKDFAEKYGVTYQAVSKWENGKNIPDISILKNICKDYDINLDDLLDAKLTKNTNYFKYILGSLLALLLIVGGIYILFRDDNDFEFRTITSTCDDFKLHGSIAYNKSKSSIYIDGLSYCGEEDNNKYVEIKCSLFEDVDKTRNEISSYSLSRKTTLEEFLKSVSFKIDDYEQTCKTYNEDSLYLEIEAITEDNNNVYYKIPLNIEDSCTK